MTNSAPLHFISNLYKMVANVIVVDGLTYSLHFCPFYVLTLLLCRSNRESLLSISDRQISACGFLWSYEDWRSQHQHRAADPRTHICLGYTDYTPRSLLFLPLTKCEYIWSSRPLAGSHYSGATSSFSMSHWFYTGYTTRLLQDRSAL